MLNDLLNGIQNFFGYRRKEAIGFLVLAGIMVVVMLGPFVWGSLMIKDAVADERDHQLLDSLVKILERRHEIHYFDFDPNTLEKDSMYLLGLRPSVVETWQNYLSKGGKFRYKSDFGKLYGLETEDFERLSSYIALPDKSTTPAPQKSVQTPKSISLDINQATANDLTAIPGIGEVLSERIVKYRELLGGYVSKEQLAEVYYLEGKALENTKESVFISGTFQPRKINLNQADYREIIKHPYIDKELANSISKIRRSADSLVTLQKLEVLMRGKESTLFALLPYIDF